jgi:hypothetical protein
MRRTHETRMIPSHQQDPDFTRLYESPTLSSEGSVGTKLSKQIIGQGTSTFYIQYANFKMQISLELSE